MSLRVLILQKSIPSCTIDKIYFTEVQIDLPPEYVTYLTLFIIICQWKHSYDSALPHGSYYSFFALYMEKL